MANKEKEQRLEVGQVWVDNDCRGAKAEHPRKVKILDIDEPGNRIVIQNLRTQTRSAIQIRDKHGVRSFVYNFSRELSI